MSEIQAHPETEEEYEDRRQELITDAAQTKQEVDQKQNEALEQIASGEDLEEYETVELGELEIEVKSWLSGSTEDLVARAAELAESGDPADIQRSKQTMVRALAEMTTADEYSQEFWQEYANRYGQSGVIVAVERVLAPAQESMEDMAEARKSFRGEPKRDGFRDGVQHDERPSE